jgi:dTDP-D-glucose 4,6-dehydratase
MQTNMENLILVTGGAEFIGSNFILQWIEQEPSIVLNLDKLTYAGSPRKLNPSRRIRGTARTYAIDSTWKITAARSAPCFRTDA